MSEDFVISPSAVEDICRRWMIRELSLFGSILREDFGPFSDVDVLVEFDSRAAWSTFDLHEPGTRPE